MVFDGEWAQNRSQSFRYKVVVVNAHNSAASRESFLMCRSLLFGHADAKNKHFCNRFQ
jgi:hypothetical protein